MFLSRHFRSLSALAVVSGVTGARSVGGALEPHPSSEFSKATAAGQALVLASHASR